MACPAYASSPVQSVSVYSCVCFPGLTLQPTLTASYVQASDVAASLSKLVVMVVGERGE